MEGKCGARMATHGGRDGLGVGSQAGFSEVVAGPPRPVGKQRSGSEGNAEILRRRDPGGEEELAALEDFSVPHAHV